MWLLLRIAHAAPSGTKPLPHEDLPASDTCSCPPRFGLHHASLLFKCSQCILKVLFVIGCFCHIWFPLRLAHAAPNGSQGSGYMLRWQFLVQGPTLGQEMHPGVVLLRRGLCHVLLLLRIAHAAPNATQSFENMHRWQLLVQGPILRDEMHPGVACPLGFLICNQCILTPEICCFCHVWLLLRIAHALPTGPQRFHNFAEFGPEGAHRGDHLQSHLREI
mmetsp:Transcript_3023/g.5712  ORF Transcript_3023/g.5712 Transcript_3023/m.5712 type:complete len:219 (+) Transcript_3023:576-1232(+)